MRAHTYAKYVGMLTGGTGGEGPKHSLEHCSSPFPPPLLEAKREERRRCPTMWATSESSSPLPPALRVESRPDWSRRGGAREKSFGELQRKAAQPVRIHTHTHEIKVQASESGEIDRYVHVRSDILFLVLPLPQGKERIKRVC